MQIRIALAVIVALMLSRSFAAGAGERVDAPTIMVISDATSPSSQFPEFLYYFNSALLLWWREGGGRDRVAGAWEVIASEHTADASDARGATIVIRRAPGGQRVQWFVTPAFTAERVRAEALGAATTTIEILIAHSVNKPESAK